MTANLKDWEVQTIDALAHEALEREETRTEIRMPARWLEKAITERQQDARTNKAYRSQLERHASRLGIGARHPKHIDQLGLDEYEIGDQVTASRWARLIKLVMTLPPEHEWREIHAAMVAAPLMESRHEPATRDEPGGWKVRDKGLGILQVLEDEAIRLGLIDGDAPLIDGPQTARSIVKALANSRSLA